MTKRRRPRLKEGIAIWIPCEVKQGMFPTERYIQIPIPKAAVPIAGFIPTEDIRKAKGAGEEVRVVISQLGRDRAGLLFRGDILSGTNPVRVPTTWLTQAAHLGE